MDFQLSEFEDRTERAQRLMHDHYSHEGMDALLLISEPEVRYFTGFRTLFWHSPTRPWFVIVPATGKPIALVPEIGRALMRATWLDDIRSWSSPHQSDDGMSLLVDALRPFSKIGLMMGRESVLRMPLADFRTINSALPGAEFVDASPLIAELRFVKSEAEIALIRQMCRITCDAFDRAPHLFRADQPLDEAFRRFKIELLKNGAEDVPYLVGGTGRFGYDDVISPPNSGPIRNGDVLMLDTGSTLKGYFCDFDRNFSVGEPEDAVKRTHETLWQATEAGLKAARPGATCADIFHAMQNMIDGSDGNVGRFGHGLGIQLTEPPSIIEWDQTVMKEGSVITLEPSMIVQEGCMLVHEENIVIRDGCAELLTRRTAREMVRI